MPTPVIEIPGIFSLIVSCWPSKFHQWKTFSVQGVLHLATAFADVKTLTGISRCSFQVMAIGFDPSCFT